MEPHQSKITHLLQNYDHCLDHDIADKEDALFPEKEQKEQKDIRRRKELLTFEKKRVQPSGRPSLFVAPRPHHYFASGFIHCCVIRNVLQSPLRVQFIFQKFGGIDDKTAMVAIKQGGNFTSNYHLFDTARVGGWSAKNNTDAVQLNKKAGNYIGKLRREKNDRSSYSLYDSKEKKEQIGAFQYSLPSLAQQFTEGQPPRKMQISNNYQRILIGLSLFGVLV